MKTKIELSRAIVGMLGVVDACHRKGNIEKVKELMSFIDALMYASGRLAPFGEEAEQFMAMTSSITDDEVNMILDSMDRTFVDVKRRIEEERKKSQ